MPIKDAVVTDPVAPPVPAAAAAVTTAEDAVAAAQVALDKALADHAAAVDKAAEVAAAHAIPVKFRVGRDDLVDGTIPHADTDDVTVSGDPKSPYLSARRMAEGSAFAPGEYYIVPQAAKAAAVAVEPHEQAVATPATAKTDAHDDDKVVKDSKAKGK